MDPLAEPPRWGVDRLRRTGPSLGTFGVRRLGVPARGGETVSAVAVCSGHERNDSRPAYEPLANAPERS
jgi:hypothetical protein